MIEAALISPVFLLLVFGVLEFGLAFRDYLTVNNAAQGGARAGAIAGNDTDADYKIIDAIRTEASAVSPGQVKRVVIFKASGTTTPVPQACTTSSTGIQDVCNVYLTSDLTQSDPSAWDNCNDPTNPARFWCSTTRKTAATAAAGNGPPDYLGVWVQVEHPWVTGLFGKTIDLTSTTIAKLEPRSVT